MVLRKPLRLGCAGRATSLNTPLASRLLMEWIAKLCSHEPRLHEWEGTCEVYTSAGRPSRLTRQRVVIAWLIYYTAALLQAETAASGRITGVHAGAGVQ